MENKRKAIQMRHKARSEKMLQERMTLLSGKGLDSRKAAKDTISRKLKAEIKAADERLKKMDEHEKRSDEMAKIRAEKAAAPREEAAPKKEKAKEGGKGEKAKKAPQEGKEKKAKPDKKAPPKAAEEAKS